MATKVGLGMMRQSEQSGPDGIALTFRTQMKRVQSACVTSDSN